MKIKIDDHLSRLKTIHSVAQNKNIEDSTMLECLSEASSFLNTIPKELQDREDYLNTNIKYRQEYEQLKDKFISWTNEAKLKIKSAEEYKKDYKNIVSNLENMKVCERENNSTYTIVIVNFFFFFVIFRHFSAINLPTT